MSAPNSNGHATEEEGPLNRADEVKDLLTSLQSLIIPFIASADEDAKTKHTGHGLQSGSARTTLVEHHAPKELEGILSKELEIGEGAAGGKEGLMGVVESILRYSVNTWDQGFLDKLYGSTNAVGLVSELLLATLNTNAHVYPVSPALTLIEKRTTTYLSSLFSLPPTTSGGITQPGGSASNATALVIARNTLYPSTKSSGNGAHHFTLFTSAHGHYSIEKAANMHGFGSANVISVPVDANGCMQPAELKRLVKESKNRGETPLFLNATAGTTVHGSFDPFRALAAICRENNMWLHIDGSWGGSVIFSSSHAASRLDGAELADSITVNPHKMLGVPLTCSFLLGADMRTFGRALRVPAGYLFHGGEEGGEEEGDIYDLASLTPQCGRRSDALKFFLALKYHGPSHFSRLVARGFENAEYLLARLKANGNFVAISPEPLPCLQVCFYWARGGELGKDEAANSRMTEGIAGRLVGRGFMVDYAPGERGRFFRVVVSGGTRRGTLDGLVRAVEECAGELGF